MFGDCGTVGDVRVGQCDPSAEGAAQGAHARGATGQGARARGAATKCCKALSTALSGQAASYRKRGRRILVVVYKPAAIHRVIVYPAA